MDTRTQTATLVFQRATASRFHCSSLCRAPTGQAAATAAHRVRGLRARPGRPNRAERCGLQHLVELLDRILLVSGPHRANEEEPDRSACTLAVDARPHATGTRHARVPYLLPL